MTPDTDTAPARPLILAVGAGVVAGAAALAGGLGFAAAALAYTATGITCLVAAPGVRRAAARPAVPSSGHWHKAHG
jgi:hypothetical protein